jgi:hypothetical protein
LTVRNALVEDRKLGTLLTDLKDDWDRLSRIRDGVEANLNQATREKMPKRSEGEQRMRGWQPRESESSLIPSGRKPKKSDKLLKITGTRKQIGRNSNASSRLVSRTVRSALTMGLGLTRDQPSS